MLDGVHEGGGLSDDAPEPLFATDQMKGKGADALHAMRAQTSLDLKILQKRCRAVILNSTSVLLHRHLCG